MAGFRTLRERMAGPPDPNEVLPLNVLPHMRQPLIAWVEDSCSQYDMAGAWEVLAQMLKVDYTATQPASAIISAVNQDNDLLLDLVDARLKLTNAYQYSDRVTNILALAGSGWQVNQAHNGLEQVVDATVRKTAQAAIDAAEASAAHHLKLSWEATHSRSRNPTLSHAEMIRAVESAARPVLSPRDLKATLGTMIGHLRSQASLYTTAGASDANDGVAGVVEMMQMLWEQQTDRHGANPTIPATQERVEFLLPITAALVHVFSTGGVRRVKS